jgi:putative tricarboxylic transport membrane protein
MFTTNSGLVWAVIASMYIGNVILLVMNLPLASLFARMLQIPYHWIYPPILAICLTGAISNANSVEDAWVMLGFGVVGWLMKRYDWPAAPMVLGLVLGPLFENTLRQSLTLSHGSGMIFVSRPIAAGLLIAAALAIVVPTLTALLMRNRRVDIPGT